MTPEMVETMLREALGGAPSKEDLERTIALALAALDGLDRCRPLLDFDDEVSSFEAVLETLVDDREGGA